MLWTDGTVIHVRFIILLFQSIFISRVSEEGPAGKSGILKGDKLISVSMSGDHNGGRG